MRQFSRKINLKPIDPDKIEIEKSNEFPMAYIFELELESTPDSVWQTIFEQERKGSFYMLKRQVYVSGDKLRVVTAPDEIQGKIEWVKGLVESTNNRVERYNEEVRREREAEERRRKEQEETIKKMRETLRT